MFDILKDKNVYNKIILSIVPLTAFCSTALSSLIAGIIIIFAVTLSWTAVSALKQFLTSKTAPFVRIVIAVGIVGILTMLCQLIFKDTVSSIGIGLTLISVTTVLLVSTDDVLAEKPFSVLKYGAIISTASAGFLFVIGFLKEFLGTGSVFGFDIYTSFFAPFEFFKTPAGALLLCAALTVLYSVLVKLFEKRGAK